jgi:hypothetical protein
MTYQVILTVDDVFQGACLYRSEQEARDIIADHMETPFPHGDDFRPLESNGYELYEGSYLIEKRRAR